MTTQRKRYPKKSTNEDLVEYSQEDAELLGIDLEEEDEEYDENLESIKDEDEEDLDEDELEEVIEEVVKPVDKKEKKAADKEKFYVDPHEFDAEIQRYYDSGHMSDELANMVSKISHKLSYASNFINYTYREEMVGDGIIRMFKALMSKKYDRVKGTNPFSYFTRIAFNAFRNRIKKEKHLRDTHEKYQQELMSMSENYNNLVKNNQLKISRDRENR